VRMNPYDPEQCALQIRDALLLPRDERERAMLRMQEGMASIYDWMESYFTAWSGHAGAASPEEGEGHPAGA